MAINLEHFTKTGASPFFNYRIVGQDALDDFVNTGIIRGTPYYSGDAYFLKGGFWDSTRMPSGRITIDPRIFNASKNPLYSGWRHSDNSNIAVLVPEKTGPAGNVGASTTYADVIDFRNRAGIRIDDRFSGKIFYDRITPFLKRPLSTHAANIGTEARIIGNAIKANPVAAAGTALGVAGTGLSVYDMHSRAQEGAKKDSQERQRSYESDGKDFPYTQAFLAETGARMPGYIEGLTNAATFGAYDVAKSINENPDSREMFVPSGLLAKQMKKKK